MDDPKVLAVSRSGIEETILATTPEGWNDVQIVLVSAVRAVLIRVVRTYLQTFAGFLLGSAVLPSELDPLAPPEAWQRIVMAAGLALFPAFVSLVQNAAELLAKWDVEHPERRG